MRWKHSSLEMLCTPCTTPAHNDCAHIWQNAEALAVKVVEDMHILGLGSSLERIARLSEANATSPCKS